MDETKKRISDSFINLLKSTPYSKISIKMICEAAPTSRNTFYYHFDSKDALVGWIVSQDFLKYSFPYFKIRADNVSTKSFFTYILEKKDFYNAIFHVNRGRLLTESLIAAYSVSLDKEHVKEYAIPRPKGNIRINPTICMRYSNAGIAAVVMYWIEGGMKIPVHDIARDLSMMLTKSLEDIRDYNLY